MAKKLLIYIVIILTILIIICFGLLVYGIYIKTASNDKDYKQIIYSLNLGSNENILDIEILDNQQLFFKIQNDKEIYGIIYDSNNNEIISIRGKQ